MECVIDIEDRDDDDDDDDDDYDGDIDDDENDGEVTTSTRVTMKIQKYIPSRHSDGLPRFGEIGFSFDESLFPFFPPRPSAPR